jgi:hypothetical protein
MNRCVLFASYAVATAACTDFATPNQLESATIVAVVSDPPIVAAGTDARLTVVVATKSGVLLAPPTAWALAEAFPGVAPVGMLNGDTDGATYRAPAMVPVRGNIPPLDAVTVTVTTDDGPLTALKAMPIAAVATTNPTITALTIGTQDALGPEPIVLAKGETAMLQVTTDPPTTADARFAWYAPTGDIKYYQSNPCEMVIPADATASSATPLIIVVRDGVGGVAWHQVMLTVN